MSILNKCNYDLFLKVVVLKMVFVNHWYILWSQIKFYVTLFHFTWGE